MTGEKVLFQKSALLVPKRRGIYKDVMKDTYGFQLLTEYEEVTEDGVTKARPVARRRRWGEDPEYDSVMCNFGLQRGADGEEICQQLVFGWANVALQEDGTAPLDYQGDIIAPEELEMAAYNFVLEHGMANEQHEWGTECGWLVESMMFTKDKMEAMGIPAGTVPEGWFVGFYIPDPDVYKKVLSGEYKMFSIEGNAKRIPLTELA